MARVFVYERPVDAILTDVGFGDNLNCAPNGIKIKQELLDPDIDKLDDSLSFTNTDTVVKCKSAAVEDKDEMIPRSLHNEGCERVTPGEHVSSKQNKPDLNRKKRKKSENPQTAKRSKSQSHRNHDIASSKSIKTSAKYVECDVCYLTFPRKNLLKLHKLSNVFINKCVKYTQLSKHKECCVPSKCQNLPRNGKYICYFCEREFPLKTSLQSHLFHIHENLISPTETPTNKMEQTAMIDSIDSHEVNVSVPGETKGSPSNATLKKMRQTTLTEFLPMFGKQLIKNQENASSNSHETVAVATTSKNREHGTLVHPPSCDSLGKAVKDKKNCTSVTSTNNRSFTDKRPFVQIHVNSDTMMSLLNTKIKTEPVDSYATVASYNFRRLRSDSRRSSVEQDGALAKLPRRKAKTVKHQDTRLWERQIKSKFNIKECIIRLTRCDKISDSGKSKVDESESFPGQKNSIQVEENSELSIDTGVESNLRLTNLEVPFMRASKPVQKLGGIHESIVSSEESNVSNDNERFSPRKTFQCKVCNKSFSSKENKREHIELFHVCYMSSICSARYTSMHKLLNHYLRQHSVFERKICCVCHEKLDAPTMLKQHMLLHCIKVIQSKKDKIPIDNETKCNKFKKYHRCKGCGKRFWLKSCLMQHQRMCHGMNARVENPVSVVEEQKMNGADPNAANIPRTSELPVRYPLRRHSIRTLNEVGVISSTSVKMESPASTVSNNPQSGKTANHRRLITGIACAKGYQVDVNGTSKIKFPCAICDKQFQTIQNLCIHERTYCKPADNPCTVCGTVFSTKRLLQRHLLATHTPSYTENYKYFCRFCNQGFVKKSNVQIHERHFHNYRITINPNPSLVPPNIWNVNTVCTVCNLMFESYERLIEHNMYYYKGQVFTCTFCGKSFQGMYMLHHHNKLMHYPEDTRNAYTYTCDTCSEGFNQESHFHAHKLHVHMHDAPSLPNLVRPVQDHAANQDHNYALMTNVGFATDETLKVPIMAYTCDICSLNFTNERDLTMHELEYSVDGDFQCDKCDRKCRTPTILINHQSLNHSGCDISNCYKCGSCGEISTTSTAMVCHEKHFHGSNTHFRSKDSASNQLDANHNARANDVGQPGNEANNLICLTCGMRFENDIKLKEHLLEYSDLGAFTCEICHRKFAESYRLEAHRIKHSRLNYILSEHHCPICHEGFTSATNVRTHVLHLHGYETFPSIVKHTGNSSRSNGNAKSPISRYNNRSRQTDCDESTSQLEQSSENNKTTNDRRRNATESPNIASKSPLNVEKKSSTCSASVRYNSTKLPSAEMQRHKTKCSDCGLVFNNSATLTRHKLRFINHGEHVCKHCGRRCPTLTILNSHLIKHSIDVQIRFLKYKCSYCDEKFRTPISMYSHIAHLHCKDQLTNETVDVNKSRINEIDMKLLKSCGNDTFDILGKVFSNDDLEYSQSYHTDSKAVDASNLDGGEGTSPSRVVTHVDKIHETVASSVEFDKETSVNCLVCNATCSNELDFTTHIEKVHVPQPPTDQIVSNSISSSSMPDDSDVIEIIWEKKSVDPGANKDLEVNDTYDSEIQVIDHNYSVATVKQPETLPLTNIVTVTDDVGKLKVKSFAKIMN